MKDFRASPEQWRAGIKKGMNILEKMAKRQPLTQEELEIANQTLSLLRK